MFETVNDLITHQRGQLQAWSNNANEIGGFIAGDIWDSLERELENLTTDGLYWDLAVVIQGTLLSALVMAFDDACEKWISKRIEALSDTMRAFAGSDWNFDTARSSLDTVRKGLRIRQRMAPKFEQLFDKARPGALRILSRALTDDLDYVLNDMEKDAEKDAARLCAVFYEARGSMTAEISQLGADLLRRAIHAYQDALTTMERTTASGRMNVA